MFCTQCGKELPPIAKFCNYCGAKTENTDTGSTTQPITTVPKPVTENENRVAIKRVILCLILPLALYAWISFSIISYYSLIDSAFLSQQFGLEAGGIHQRVNSFISLAMQIITAVSLSVAITLAWFHTGKDKSRIGSYVRKSIKVTFAVGAVLALLGFLFPWIILRLIGGTPWDNHGYINGITHLRLYSISLLGFTALSVIKALFLADGNGWGWVLLSVASIIFERFGIYLFLYNLQMGYKSLPIALLIAVYLTALLGFMWLRVRKKDYGFGKKK